MVLNRCRSGVVAVVLFSQLCVDYLVMSPVLVIVSGAMYLVPSWLMLWVRGFSMLVHFGVIHGVLWRANSDLGQLKHGAFRWRFFLWRFVLLLVFFGDCGGCVVALFLSLVCEVFKLLVLFENFG